VKTYEQLTKERDALLLKIQECKLEIDVLPPSGTEASALLTTLASLGIQYAEVQRELMNWYKNRL